MGFLFCGTRCTLVSYTGWPKKKKPRNGILPVVQLNNDWYQCMGYLLIKMIPRSPILVKWFLF